MRLDMIEDTNIWETRSCGCRLQLSLYHYDSAVFDSDDPENPAPNPMEMWVIREECEKHAEQTARAQETIEAFMRGDPGFTFTEENLSEEMIEALDSFGSNRAEEDPNDRDKE